MTLTDYRDAAVTGADAKHAVVSGLASIAAFLETHPGVTWPVPVMNVEVPGETREEQLAALAAIAREWGTEVASGPAGIRYMARAFGGIAVEAHVYPFSVFSAAQAEGGAAA